MQGLVDNIRLLPHLRWPVLIEGAQYRGIWLECAPLEGLVADRWLPGMAIANHRAFFALQREDGQFPCLIRQQPAYSQIQIVVPIAATAWETAQMTRDEAFLAEAYDACSGWDDWLMANRNTRGTGLCELFCEYDTGHDNSPRVAGLPRTCPAHEARNCPSGNGLPWLAPDLSASVYGGRLALSAMAEALDRPGEAGRWACRAAELREQLIHYCYDAEDACFYDLDRDGRCRKVRGDLLTRVCGEHVPDARLFETIYQRHLSDPQAFWTPLPFPSIAANDPSFDWQLPVNSWGGGAQALTALRAPRWLAHYGKHADLERLMHAWVRAIVEAGAFHQQASPWTGRFTVDPGGYSPAMCVLLDFVRRLELVDLQGLVRPATGP